MQKLLWKYWSTVLKPSQIGVTLGHEKSHYFCVPTGWTTVQWTALAYYGPSWSLVNGELRYFDNFVIFNIFCLLETNYLPLYQQSISIEKWRKELWMKPGFSWSFTGFYCKTTLPWFLIWSFSFLKYSVLQNVARLFNFSIIFT